MLQPGGIREPRGPRRNHHGLAVVIGACGVAVCLAAVAGFVASVATNNLPWYPGWTVQEHYLEMGRSYSQGFLVGFFLCFFLVMCAFSAVAWVDARRRRAETEGRATARASHVHP